MTGISPEVFDSHMEVQTPPCGDFDAFHEELLSGRRRAQNLAHAHGMDICSAGTLSCYRWQEVEPLPIPRILQVVGDFSESFQSQSIAALHVHTKLPTLGESLNMVNALSRYIWLFLALSGSSRFYDGHDTGLSSRRVSLIGQTQRTGIPPFYRTEADYQGEQSALALGGWEDNKLWYALRHNPHHHTVELRVMDAIPLVEDVLAVSALFLCICHALQAGVLEPVDMSHFHHRVLAQINLERAMCTGTNGVWNDGRPVGFFLTPDRELTLFEAVAEMLSKLESTANQLGCMQHLSHVERIAQQGNASQRQRRAVQSAGNLSAATILVRDETLRGI